MKNKLPLVLGLSSAIILGGFAQMVLAEKDKTTERGFNPAVVSQVDIINQLINLGDARKDPILLLAAAKLQTSISEESAPASTQSHTTSAILERAKADANGRKDIIGLADDIAASKTKGYDRYHPFANERW